ncbi:MAG: hypothetical protein ABEI27_04065 [Halobellus sp.]|uniref:hypothetical protein n=1 Tax=Halobellus sp. TaxID=1979212 RepID=UPI0035D3FD20
MERRHVLRGFAGASVLWLTGCLATEPDAGTDADTDTTMPDDTDTPTGTPTDDAEPSVTDRSLTVTDSGCGQVRDEATVSFDESAGTVTVTGTVWGNDLAYVARLASVSYEDGTLTVTVASERSSETAVAGDCISEISYEATVAVAGGLPGTVEVVHVHGDERTTAATVDRP